MALTDNIRAYYKFNANADDSTANARNGTPTNSPTYTSGNLGDALTLAASSSQHVLVPNAVFPWGTNTVTINFWLKVASTSGNQGFFMVARTGQGAMVYNSGNLWDFAKPNVVSTTYSWTTDSNWHMWTFVADASGMRYYKDGNSTPVASGANTANFVDPIGDTIPIGGYKSGGSMVAGWYTDGQIQHFGVWSDAKSTADIASLYNSGAGVDLYPSGGGTVYRRLALTGVGN